MCQVNMPPREIKMEKSGNDKSIFLSVITEEQARLPIR